MISSIAWIPAGVADPNPKRYELSSAEKDLIKMMEEKGNIDDIIIEEEKKIGTTTTKLPKIDNNSLPADLRMDEYSSDEDDDNKAGVTIGQLLVGAPTSMVENMATDEMEEEDDDEVEEDGMKNRKPQHRSKMDDDDEDDDESNSDSDDDLDDIPDTREYEPVDVAGLQAMGLSQVGMAGLGIDDLNVEDDDSEADDVKISTDDALIAVAKTEDDFASLEVHCYDQKMGTMYVHHDIPLPAFPLCLAHGQVSRDGQTGNFCAVGTFGPGIEIWNLDVLNALEPSCILGGEDTSIADDLMRIQILNAAKGNGLSEKQAAAMRSAQSGHGGLRPGSHTDAVMALSWNTEHKQVIASGSADCTVKLWDVTKAGDASCNASTFSHHKNKVQSVVWNPKEATLLASGSYDRTIALLDARTPGNNANVKHVKISSDCEALAWDPFRNQNLTVVTEDGTMSCWDVRKFKSSTPLWTFVASEFGGITDICYNTQIPGLLATSSTDKTVTLWDAHDLTDSRPRSCGNKDMCSGKLYTVAFYPSSPWLLGCGGSGNVLSLWNLDSEETIQKRFAERYGNEDYSSNNNNTSQLVSTILDNKDVQEEVLKKKKDSVETKQQRKKDKRKKKVHRKS